MPVADFFGNHPVRRDFIGSLLNDDSAKEMEQRFAPIWRRLGELLYRAPPQGRTAMTGHPFLPPRAPWRRLRLLVGSTRVPLYGFGVRRDLPQG